MGGFCGVPIGARVRDGVRQIAAGVCDGVATGWKTLTRFRRPRFGPARVPRHAKSGLTQALSRERWGGTGGAHQELSRGTVEECSHAGCFFVEAG